MPPFMHMCILVLYPCWFNVSSGFDKVIDFYQYEVTECLSVLKVIMVLVVGVI